MSFKTDTVEYDDMEFKATLKQYLDIRANVDPDKELKKRAINIGYKLIRIYMENGATKESITSTVKNLGFRVKIRDKIRQMTKTNKKGITRGLTRAQMIRRELKSRLQSIGLNASGWFPALIRLGANAYGGKLKRKPRGKVLGDLKFSRGGWSPYVELINQQSAAEFVADKAGNAIQLALELESEDMMKKIIQTQEKAAARAGL
jgi:hypothetical protein